MDTFFSDGEFLDNVSEANHVVSIKDVESFPFFGNIHPQVDAYTHVQPYSLSGIDSSDDLSSLSTNLMDANHIYGSMDSVNHDALLTKGITLTSPDASGNHILEEYNHNATTNYITRIVNPVGAYAVNNICGLTGLPEVETFSDIDIPRDYTVGDLQNVANTICDALHWDHIPVEMSEAVDNMRFSSLTGIFRHTTIDDSISIRPEYVDDCISRIGTTDIVASDIAHEIGHSIAYKICGDMGTYMDEKLADFISGFANGKLGLDIDAARKWFEWHYDNAGQGGYPISEDRWNAQAAGYYFSHLANGDHLLAALKDNNFLNMISAYQHGQLEWTNFLGAIDSPNNYM